MDMFDIYNPIGLTSPVSPFNPASPFFIGRHDEQHRDKTETIQIVPCNSPKTVTDRLPVANDKSYLDAYGFMICSLILILCIIKVASSD